MIHHQDDKVTLHYGDCLDIMRELPDNSVDAICTDPPYGLGFMGKGWDDLPPGEPWARECLRVLKPGGHLLAFGGTRTWHRLACAIEDAGFEMRDSIAWLYGSGFPKSLDVSKAIDKAAGATREVIGPKVTGDGHIQNRQNGRNEFGTFAIAQDGIDMLTAPATDDARTWQGWGTALKPGHEPVVVARKPLDRGTVAANVLAHGTGALNVDATRISAGQDYLDKCASVVGIDSNRNGDAYGEWTGTREDSSSPAGRWPANVVLDQESAAELDRQSGTLTSGRLDRAGIKADSGIYGKAPESRVGVYEQDSGGASRFFYVPQEDTCSVASLDTAGTTAASTPTGTAPAAEPPVPLDALGSRFRYQAKAPTKERPSYVGDDGNKISHATVKPLTLMRWLVRLVTPPGGTVLEPFAGSGTTVEAAVLEGFRCVAIEREADYLPLIMARLDRTPTAPAEPVEVLPDLGPTVDDKIAAQVAGQLTIDEASA